MTHTCTCLDCGMLFIIDSLDFGPDTKLSCPSCGEKVVTVEAVESGKSVYSVRIPLEADRWFTVCECCTVEAAIEVLKVLVRANAKTGYRVMLEYSPQ